MRLNRTQTYCLDIFWQTIQFSFGIWQSSPFSTYTLFRVEVFSFNLCQHKIHKKVNLKAAEQKYCVYIHRLCKPGLNKSESLLLLLIMKMNRHLLHGACTSQNKISNINNTPSLVLITHNNLQAKSSNHIEKGKQKKNLGRNEI